MSYGEEYNQLKQELAKLTEEELRTKWRSNDATLQEMEHEAREHGYSRSIADEYFGSDLSAECDLINKILVERGLAEEERQYWPEEDEDVEFLDSLHKDYPGGEFELRE